MLGLGISLSSSGTVSSGGIAPSDISGLDAWFRVNTGIAGASNTSDAGNMVDGEDITSWADQSGNNRHASQSTDSKKPHWETDAADFGGLHWPDDVADTHLNLASNVSINANQDFTVMVRMKFANFDTAQGLVASGPQDVIKWTTNKRVAVILGGSGATEFEEASDTLAADTYYIHTLTRKDGSTGNLTYHIHGGTYSDKFWENDLSTRQDADAFFMNNIGCAADGVLPVDGVIKDVIFWKGTALSDSERNDMYTYINGQAY